MTHRSALFICVSLCLSSLALADDWPQWRGPQRDGVWCETGIIDAFAGPQAPRLWSAPVGPGYSGPTVAQGRVYVADRQVSPEPVERVLCFDADTGKRLWMHSYRCQYAGFSYTAGPRAAVTVQHGRAYALGAMGHLTCLAADTGRVLWTHDLNSEYKIRMPHWGIAAAPIVEGDLVAVQIGGKSAGVVAFDCKTGQERWRALDEPATYSAPIVIDQAGRRVLVVVTSQRLAGLDANTGRVLWQCPFPALRWPDAAAAPVWSGDRIFVSAFYEGSLMVRLRDDMTVEEVWRRRGKNERNTDALHAMMATPIFDGAYVYGVDSYGELRCLDASNGDRVWSNTALRTLDRVHDRRRNFDRWFNAHLVANAGRIWAFNEKGELIICRMTPQGYEEISRAKLIEPTRKQHPRGVCWSHPAFANRRVYIRSDKELVCADLAAK